MITFAKKSFHLIPPNTHLFVAKTLAGLEEALEQELKELGATNTQILTRAVSFEGTRETIYRANYHCRTAIKILVPLIQFKASSNEELYEGVRSFQWDQMMSFRDTFMVETVLVHSAFQHSHFISLKTKDAVADWFTDKYKRRPNVDRENPDIRLSLYIHQDECTLYLDSSGDPLFKRGYRLAQGPAPMSEVLAAGLIKLSGWNGEVNFVDPFCGSGTLLTEAALIAHNLPAGLFRKSFGFMHWRDFDRTLWNDIKADARKRKRNQECEIFGSDISEEAITIASKNIHRAGFSNEITLKKARFEDTSFDGPGVLVTNPPYGERLQTNDIVALYKSIGDTLKHNYKGFDAWIITSDFFALKNLGLHPTKKITLYNGPLECRFAHFEIYEGSRKQKKDIFNTLETFPDTLIEE
ncbi:MAG: THUMP domain-containing protein [Lentimicrobium sp.]